MDKIKKNVSIELCPQCNGKGYELQFQGDSDSKIPCGFCLGKKVVQKLVTTQYFDCDEQL